MLNICNVRSHIILSLLFQADCLKLVSIPDLYLISFGKKKSFLKKEYSLLHLVLNLAQCILLELQMAMYIF
jgi:hypothetical protein